MECILSTVCVSLFLMYGCQEHKQRVCIPYWFLFPIKENKMFFELEHWEKCCEWTSKAETSLILPADREKTLHEAGISPCMLAAVSGGLRTGFSAMPGD